MEINLRFGMHRDIDVIRSHAALLNGVVLPANILSHYASATSVFISSLSKPYVVDPMTFIIQSSLGGSGGEAGELRPSTRKLLSTYDGELCQMLESPGSVSPDDLRSLEGFTANVIRFQQEKVTVEHNKSKAAKYLRRYRRTTPTGPACVIPPYFRFAQVGDGWYRVSLEFAIEAAELSNPDDVTPVICFSPRQLHDEVVEQIASDYGRFGSVLLWPDDFSQNAAEAATIQAVRALVRALSSKSIKVNVLYGGYLMMLMARDGVGGISHGILYTQHRSYQRSPGKGGAPERYYIPAIHDFRSLSQTDLLMHLHPDLLCDCETCARVIAGNPDNIILFADNPDLLKAHFLDVRSREARQVVEQSPEQIIDSLRDSFEKYNESFNSLPNPDAVVTGGTIPGLQYLANWISAFE